MKKTNNIRGYMQAISSGASEEAKPVATIMFQLQKKMAVTASRYPMSDLRFF